MKGSTPPKRCQAMVPEGTMRFQCEKRVHKAGLCIEHYASMKISKAQDKSEPLDRCDSYKCFRVAVISIEGKKQCMRCFNRSQKKVKPTMEEANNV